MSSLAFPGGVVELDGLPSEPSGATTLATYPILIIGEPYVEESSMRISYVARDVQISWLGRELTCVFHMTEFGWIADEPSLWSGDQLSVERSAFLRAHLAIEAESVP